jgi:hypothetical protein
MLQLFRSRLLGGKKAADGSDPAGEWEFLWIGSMWFQDLWTYDFRRTEMCVIPYATQEGEISFCAYNTGVGWRQIVENMHMVATTSEWFQQKGRHTIYAGDRPIPCRTRSSGGCRWSRWRRGTARPAAETAGAGAGAAAAAIDAGGVSRRIGEPWDLGPIDEGRRPVLQSLFATFRRLERSDDQIDCCSRRRRGTPGRDRPSGRRGLRGRPYLQGLGDPAPAALKGPHHSIDEKVTLQGLHHSTASRPTTERSTPPETRCSRSG